jgi:MFS family permease
MLTSDRALLYFSIAISTSSISLFMPTILRDFGYSAAKSQVYTIPVYMTSLVVTISFGWLSDYLRRRAIFVFIGCAISTIGYIVLLCQGALSIEVKYGAVFIVSAGIFIAAPVTMIWLLTNLSGHYKRGIGMSVQIGFGNIGSIVASNIFISKEAPKFITGYSVALAFVVLEAVLALVFLMALKRENGKRNSGSRNWRFDLPKEEADNMGDDHPDFRFCY